MSSHYYDYVNKFLSS